MVGCVDWGGGISLTFSGKLSLALLPLKRRAASSYALAAASAVSKVPSQTLAALCGSRISAAHFPQGLCRTPLYLFLSPVSSCEVVVEGSGCVVCSAAVAAGTEEEMGGGAVVAGVILELPPASGLTEEDDTSNPE